MNISALCNPFRKLFSRESHSTKKQENSICNILHVFHMPLCLFSKCVPLNIIGVRLFGFSFGWEVHKHRSRVQSQLEKNSNGTCSFSFHAISTSKADIQ